tara:strand:- start:4493 stop:5332 length:840 start_codon:yes stop_codon:yes gene_type:complete
MDTSREDVGIAIRSAFLKKGTQQRFSLFLLILVSIFLLFVETIESKPLNFLRSAIKDTIYRGSVIVSSPAKGVGILFENTKEHITLYGNYEKLKKENVELKNQLADSEFLALENSQLKEIIGEQIDSDSNYVTSRVMLDKQSPYLNSFILNSGSNKEIKKGMAVLDGKNFIGRIVDVNYFSSRVLLISDLNSKIPVIVQPDGYQAILSGRGTKNPVLEYLPKNNSIENGNKVYTSGKEGIFSPGIPIGEIKFENEKINVNLFSNLTQITYVNIELESFE